MAKEFSIKLSGKEAELMLEAIDHRKAFLDDTASGLLKKKLGDAAKPLFDAIGVMTAFADRVRTEYNKAQG